MLYHARRLWADVKGIRGWLLAVATATFLASLITTLAVAEGRQGFQDGTLSPDPPRSPLSFVRVVDPSESIQQDLDTFADSTVLDTPGVSLLLDRVSQDRNSFMTLPLGAFTSDLTVFSEMAHRGRVVVGTLPSLHRGPSISGRSELWGSLPDGLRSVSDSRLGPVPLDRASTSNVDVQYVAGNGRRVSTADQPLVVMDVAAARSLGVYAPYRVSDVVGSFTCYCSTARLDGLADRMTTAERRAGSPRVFYAVGYPGLVGPVERSATASGVETAVVFTGVLVALGGFVVMAAHLFWVRRRHDYGVEWRFGASRLALLARQQVVTLVGITVPVGLGYLVIEKSLRTSLVPPPLTSSADANVLAMLVGVQAVLGLQTLGSMNRELRAR